MGGARLSHAAPPAQVHCSILTLRSVAVGTAITDRPPHRSQRALLTHWAPPSGPGVEAVTWQWV
jgi:hypothetical protein